MKNIKRSVRVAVATAISVGIGVGAPAVTYAAKPQIATNYGAFVRVLGSPDDGTIKFQYGWYDETAASDAAGYWVGLYDVTHSHYVWSFDTGPAEMPDQLMRNAIPTAELPNGEYKVVFFVRDTYGEPTTNIAEIEYPITVDNSMM